MDGKLLQYIPKFYKPYISDIHLGERVWNEHTRRWNNEVIVEWCVNDEYETTVYQNASHMYNTLKELGNDFVDSNLELVTI